MDKIQQTKLAIVAMAASQILHEALDELVDAPFYKQNLKRTCNAFEKEITKVCDSHIKNLWGIDEEIIRSIQDGISEVCKEVATMDPEKICEFGQLLKNGLIEYEPQNKKECLEKVK